MFNTTLDRYGPMSQSGSTNHPMPFTVAVKVLVSQRGIGPLVKL
jgi:hypothetical protein